MALIGAIGFASKQLRVLIAGLLGGDYRPGQTCGGEKPAIKLI